MKTNLLLKKSTIFLVLIIGLNLIATAQNVAITDDDTYNANTQAMLDVKSDSKGVLVPRVALVGVDNPISGTKPAGLLVWNTSDGTYSIGFYFWNGIDDWEMVGSNTVFSSGLTQIGDEVTLGGTLTQSTTITQGAYGMTYNLTGLGDFNIQDNGTSAFFVKDDGNIGMGTTNPITDLHVVGSSVIGSVTIAPNVSSSGDAEIFLAEDNDKSMGMSWTYDGGLDEMYLYGKNYTTIYGPHMTINRIDGKVGIGTTAPAALLDVDGNVILGAGVAVSEFSSDVNLAGNSNLAVPTERAVKTYVDNKAGAGFSGTGTANYLSKWTSTSGLGSSIVYENSSKVGIGTTTPTSKFVVYGNNGQTDDDAIFEVKNDAGQTVFAVYPKGVRINVDESIVKGKAAGSRGGFAVGNLATGKLDEEFLRVTRDSVRINVSEASKAAGSRGGFAVGNLATGKAGGVSLMQIRPENYFIGHNAGDNTTGVYNSFFGFHSGENNTSGSNNVFMGYYTGLANTTGSSNIFLGNNAGLANLSGRSNVFVGNNVGLANTTGNYNVFVGDLAGRYNTEGFDNVFIGRATGYLNNTGDYNVFLGDYAGMYNTAGSNNVFMGNRAGYRSVGDSNVYIGNKAGYYSTSGNNNVSIGLYAGNYNGSGNDNIYIGNFTGYGVYGSNGYSNTFMGVEAGKNIVTAHNNSLIGYQAGWSITEGYGNVALGDSAGYELTTGYMNTMIGSGSGVKTSTGGTNTYLGNGAGISMNAHGNTFIGNRSGGGYGGSTAGTGGYNATIGTYGLYNLTTGGYNTSLGSYAGYSLSTGSRNVFLGYKAGGSYFTRFPIFTSESGNNGDDNVFIGPYAGSGEPFDVMSDRLVIHNAHVSSVSDVLIYGEFDNKKLRFNANIGVNATPSTSYGIYVDNNDTPGSNYGIYSLGGYYGVRATATGSGSGTVYGSYNYSSSGSTNYGVYGKGYGGSYTYGVYGYGSSGSVTNYGLRGYGYGGTTAYGVYGYASGGTYNRAIYGSASTVTNSYAGYFSGNVKITGTLTQGSDKRLKNNIEKISGALEKLNNIDGVTYNWKSNDEIEVLFPSTISNEVISSKFDEEDNDKGENSIQNSDRFNFSQDKQIGVIAQDVEKVFPELVITDGDGMKSVNYIGLIPVLIEAIKEQQIQIDKQSKEIEILKAALPKSSVNE